MRLGSDLALYAATVAASAAAHVALIGGLSGAAGVSGEKRPPTVEITVLRTPEPIPERVVEAEKPKLRPPPPSKPKPKPKPLTNDPPPPNTESAAEPEQAPAPPVFGVTMRSTVSGGSGLRVRVGNTLMKEPEKDFTQPQKVKPYAGPPKDRYVAPSQVSKMARPIGPCKGEYPPAAKRLGIEGKVVLRITIEKDGSVDEVTVQKGLGYGLDQVAVAAMSKCRFQPALKEGEPVAVRVTYRFRFELDDG